MLRLVIVTTGDPDSSSTNSGVAKGTIDALSARDDIEITAIVNSSLGPWQRVMCALASWHPQRAKWKSQYRNGFISAALRSCNRARQIRKTSKRADFVLHIRGTYLPMRMPYAAFIDTTQSQMQSGWQEWRMCSPFFAITDMVERCYLASASAVLTASVETQGVVKAQYGNSKTFAVGGGGNFPVTERPPTHVEGTGRLNVLFVGFDFERKGGPAVVKAVQACRQKGLDARLRVVGGEMGPPAPGIEYTGRVNNRQAMRDHFEWADTLALPAIHEPYGLVVQEAMSFGIPCIVSDVNSLPSIIGGDGAAGFVVPTGRRRGIETALEELLMHPHLRQSMGERGQELLADMTWDKTAERVVDVLARI